MIVAEKTSQVFLHMAVAFAVTYLCTGSTLTGGVAAILEPICNVIIMPWHEHLWKNLHARQRARKAQGAYTAA